MKHITIGALLGASVAGSALAGGLDRSGQDIGLLFENGNVVKFSAAYVDPNITSALTGTSDAAPSYIQLSFGYKQALSDSLSLAVIYDQPYGASISYTDGPFAGVNALVTSNAVTGLLRYEMGNGFGVHGGVRAQQLSANVNSGFLDVTSDWGIGGVIGASWERPEIAARVALTYSSEISHTMTGTEMGGPSSFPVTTPQSVNLDFQTGVAANTLVFGSIRWTNWNGFTVTGVVPYVAYDRDVITYSLGVGRKFSDSLSGAITVGYEAPSGTPFASPLSPTDGYISLGVGATYTMGSGTKITGGVRYVWLGDRAPFTGNSTIAAGLSVTHEF